MKNSPKCQIEKYINKITKKKNWHRIIACLAVMAVVATTYFLILPAVTMEEKTICGKEEHTHSESCYKVVTKGNLLCEQGLKIHKHTKDCYDEEHNLICGKADFVLHKHGDTCKEDGKLICPLKEEAGHQHTEACYDNDGALSCGQEESYKEHEHTEDCYKTEDGNKSSVPVCGKLEVEEHQHTKECFPEKIKECICEKEEHIHTKDCYETETSPAVNKTKSAVSRDEDGEKDFGEYITKVTVSKLENGSWVESDEFTDGDQVRVSIQYRLPANTVDGENLSISYQLPDGIRPIQEETGIVYDGEKPVGTYVINEEGKITITFNDEFADGDAFSGTIQFQGSVSLDDSGEDGKIHFGGDGGTITIIPVKEKNDIKIQKQGTPSDDKKKVDYTVTVSTVHGTEGEVRIEDSFVGGNAVGSYDKDSFKIYRVDSSGEKEEISTEDYQIQFTEEGKEKFTITDLPKLEAGEQYILTYSADAETTDPKGSSSIINQASAESGGTKEWSWNQVEISKSMIDKNGWYDQNSDFITWVVTVNQDKQDISGYEFQDQLPEGIEIQGDIEIKDSTGKVIHTISAEEANKNGIQYTFPENSKDTYTITYQTKAPKENGKVTNDAELKNGDDTFEASKEVEVTHRDWNLTKSFNSKKTDEEGLTVYTWQTKITAPEGEFQGIVYTDTIENAADQDGMDQGANSHYGIAADLQKALEESFNMVLSNGQTLKYDSQQLKITITYYDADGKEISSDDTKTEVKKFEIRIDPAEGVNLECKQIDMQYTTVADFHDMEYGDTWTFRNKGEIPDHKTEASTEEKKDYPLEKQAGMQDPQGSISYGSGSAKVDYDESDGILYYRLLIRTEPGSDEEILLTDTLPEGAQFIEDSLDAKFYTNDWTLWDSIETWEPEYKKYDFKGEQKPSSSVDGQKLQIKIQSGYNINDNGKKNGNVIAVTYRISIKDDEFWDNLKNESQVYTNHVEWGNYEAEQETTVDREVEKVQKTGQQLEGEDGKPTNVVEYRVIINPAADDLNPESDVLTLTDQLSIGQSGAEAYLNLQSLKLYQYQASAEDSLGEEIDSSRYQVIYQQQERKMTVTLPDELACVLVYQYTIDPGNVSQPSLTNKISLEGEYAFSNQIKLEDTSSSATANKNKITIYKVDGENYTKLLPGAEFELSILKDKEWVEIGDYTTDEKGQIVFQQEGDDKIETNRLYRLTETKAPSGYAKTEEHFYFVWMEEGKDADQTYNEMGGQNTFEQNQVQKSQVQFIGGQGGSLYIPNDYTRINVKKIWVDKENHEITPPQDEIKVQLYRQTQKPDGYKVTIRSKSANGEIVKEISQIVKKDSQITICLSGWTGTKFTIEYGGKEEVIDRTNGETFYTVEQISKDMEIEITSDDEWNAQDPTISEFVPPDSALTEKEKVGDPVSLTGSNHWSYAWDNLDQKDQEGNPYLYTLEEIHSLEGCKVEYTNNDGIQTGEIIVTNKLSGYEMPETGGPGTIQYYGAGLLMTAAAGFFFYRKMKHQR